MNALQSEMPAPPTKDKEKLLAHLKTGKWAFDTIHPHFRESLKKRLSISQKTDAPTCALTLLAYRNRNLPPPTQVYQSSGLQVFGKDDDKKSSQQWNEILHSLNLKGGQVGTVSKTWLKTIHSAMLLIKKNSPLSYSALTNHVSHICTLETKDYRSASHPHLFGVLFLKKTYSTKTLALSIVHELAHQELFLINLVDRLVNASMDYNLVHAPFQGKLRPPIGRLHASHALFRMLELEPILNKNSYTNLKQKLRQTALSFSQNELTPLGAALAHEIYL